MEVCDKPRKRESSDPSCDRRMEGTKQLPMASMRCEGVKILSPSKQPLCPTFLIICESLNGSVFWAGVLYCFHLQQC